MELRSSKPQSSISCPKCGYDSVPGRANFCPACEAAILKAPKPAAQIEVSQEVGSVEGGRVVGVDLGQVSGDVNIGNYTLRIGSMHGGVVNLAPAQQQQLPQPRPVPVRLLPRQSPGLLGRKAEVAATTTALQAASPAEFHGPAGIGKTKLLRHLAYQQFTSGFSDGVVYFSAIRHKPVDDLLLELFDAFYEREATYKPTSVQVRHALQAEQALIILDDVDLGRDEVAELMDTAPSCTFLLASIECCLWGEGQALALQGLARDDALELLERELGRPLSAEERPAAEALCTVLEGHPLSLLQLAALVKEDGHSLPNLAALLRDGPPAEALREQALAACSEQEKQILAVLAVPRGASLGKQHVSALTGIEDIDIPIASLKQRKLAQSYSPRYSLTGSLERTLGEEWDLTPWNEQALEHFATWAEHNRPNPQLVAEETDAILGILRWALREQRWEGALRLGRAVEGALAVGGQWGAWAQVLSSQLQAARELGDRAAEAWSLHQSGAQALCLEDYSVKTRTDLSEALRIRESLGDWAGAAVTRHNLDLFFGGPGGTSGSQGNGSGGGGWSIPRLPLWQWLIALVATLVTLGLSSSAIFGASPSLSLNKFLEPAVQLLEPAVPLLKPAVPLLEPAVQLLKPTSNSDEASSTPSSKLDSSNGNSSNPGNSSDSNPSDDSSPGTSSTKLSDTKPPSEKTPPSTADQVAPKTPGESKAPVGAPQAPDPKSGANPGSPGTFDGPPVDQTQFATVDNKHGTLQKPEVQKPDPQDPSRIT